MKKVITLICSILGFITILLGVGGIEANSTSLLVGFAVAIIGITLFGIGIAMMCDHQVLYIDRNRNVYTEDELYNFYHKHKKHMCGIGINSFADYLRRFQCEKIR